MTYLSVDVLKVFFHICPEKTKYLGEHKKIDDIFSLFAIYYFWQIEHQFILKYLCVILWVDFYKKKKIIGMLHA